MTPADSNRVGGVVGGKYRLVRCIGAGGMGEVYEAQHVTVGRRFALKFLQRHLAQYEDALERFRREARAAGALENEHIAGVLDIDTASDGTPFLVMEYLVGESVAELLRREGPLPVTRAVSIVQQVCRGLEAAHAAGIIHRDLKPDNLFSLRRADGSELIKILDFGIAKLSNDEPSSALTRSGAMLGTPFYMAPEQARGDKMIDARVDVYALGVILYELLSGEKPHPGDSHNAILAHILTEPIVPLERLRAGLPGALTAVVSRTLSRSRDERPSSVAAFARELAPFQGSELGKVQSQFDLRAPRVDAKTLPTPDTHALALAPPPPRQGTRFGHGALVAAALAGLALLGLYFSRWPPSISRDAATATTASAPHAPPPVESIPASAGAAAPLSAPRSPPPALSAPSGASADVVGRPGGRPRKVSSAEGRSATAGSSKPPESPPNSPEPKRAPRVDFDTKNPYQ